MGPAAPGARSTVGPGRAFTPRVPAKQWSEEELRLARLANDGLAEIVQRYPRRFLGVATLPFSSPAEALREFDRCVDSLGFKGFQISSNVNGTLLDAPELFPIYERVAQRGWPSAGGPCGFIRPHP